jgi:APA family basic amino acid/polyamine antiporter
VAEDDTRRRLGLGSATALVVANMVGVGVFTTSGFSLADLGRPEWVLLAWLVGGLIAMCGALSYGALARRMPESGGEYYFLSRLLHPSVGFLAGCVSLLAGFTVPIAAAALTMEAYIADSFEVPVSPGWIGTATITVAAVMHGLRPAYGVNLQNIAVVAKVLLILGFIAFGASRLPGLPNQPTLTTVAKSFDIPAFAVTLVWISFAYSGWNATVYLAGEVRDPDRTLHRSLWLGTVIVTLAYLGLNTVFVYAAPVEELAGKGEVGAIAAQALGGPELRRAVSALVALALFTSVSAMMMAGPRVYAKMAEDGLFPTLLASRGEAPTLAVCLQAGLAIVLVWVSQLRELLGYIGFTLGVTAALTVIGLLRLRAIEGPERIPIPGYPWVPWIFVLSTFGASSVMFLRQPLEAGLGLVTILGGLPIYWLLSKRQR